MSQVSTLAFFGSGQGVDNQDFLADLEAVGISDADTNIPERSVADIEVDIPMLDRTLNQDEMFGYCAWCMARPSVQTRSC